MCLCVCVSVCVSVCVYVCKSVRLCVWCTDGSCSSTVHPLPLTSHPFTWLNASQIVVVALLGCPADINEYVATDADNSTVDWGSSPSFVSLSNHRPWPLSLSLLCCQSVSSPPPSHTNTCIRTLTHSLLACLRVLLQPSFASELTLQLFQDDVQIEAATTSAIVPFGRTTFTYKSQQPLSVGGQVQCTFTVSTKQCVHPQNTFSGPCYFPSFSPSFCAAAAASTPGPLH